MGHWVPTVFSNSFDTAVALRPHKRRVHNLNSASPFGSTSVCPRKAYVGDVAYVEAIGTPVGCMFFTPFKTIQSHVSISFSVRSGTFVPHGNRICGYILLKIVDTL